MEDLAYFRMLNYCYLKEIGLPKSLEEIGRLIRMRSHCDCIKSVLREFFTLDGDVYKHRRVDKEIDSYKSKSKKASESANARWAKTKDSDDANALRTDCEGNANHKPATINHKPITNIKEKGFIKPTLSELIGEFSGRVINPDQQANTFLNHYASNGWKVGKNSMKSWQHSVTNWIARDKAKNPPRTADKITELTNRSWATQKLEKT